MDPVSSSTSPSTGTSSTTATAKTETTEEQESTNALSADFDTFLQLLTAQMQNQDPLEPTNNTEWVAQLASFSSVEQQIEANEKLTDIKDVLGIETAEGLGSWIDKQVLVDGGMANFQGEPVDIEFEPTADAEQSNLIVRDEAGAIVGRVSIPTGASEYTWDGTYGNGNTVDPGYYSFTIENYVDGEVSGHTVGKVFAPVSEVRLTGDGTELVLTSGQKVMADEVTAIR
ncbi:flagellar hook capping FlgD N-terminal domain-containing protein [Amaricoccus tamworthensis]|uniref:flagellar hook capping FlgD N-terminal domain-containing protein n=1 Tax=Amaricoccus tamworthensis TaxID=57002 RepID=UPI003C7B6BB8